MKMFLMKDYLRIDPMTGGAAEKDFSADFEMFDDVITLHSARNQFVSFQLIVDTEGETELTDFTIQYSDLSGNCTTLKADYETHIEWFHDMNSAFMPDLLIPFGKTVDFKIPLDKDYLPHQRCGALWIDLFVPADAAGGVFGGTITAVANGTEKVFHVKLHVYRCAVPNKSRVVADFNNYADSISMSYEHLAGNPNRYRDGSFFEVEGEFMKVAREHRCCFQHLNYLHSGAPVESFAPELEGSGKTLRVKSWELFDRHFGAFLDGSAFQNSRRGAMPIEFMFLPFNMGWPADYTKYGKPGFKTEYRRIIWEFMKHFEEKGWTETSFELMLNHKKEYRFFPSSQDEIWYEHDEEVAEYMYDVIKDTYEHSKVKFLFRADSSNHYHNHFKSHFADMFDMWVASMTMFSWCPESVVEMRNRKNVLWIYGWYGMGMTVDLPLNAFLTHPMICFMTGATGFCSFWNAVGFGEDYLRRPFVNGGQAIFYPGTKFGLSHVLPSIRLKVLRNQMQLTDLMTETDGLDIESFPQLKRELCEIVNKHFGYEGMEDWWQPKPDFLDTPPRYWDWSNVPHRDHYTGKSPIIIERLRNDVYRLLDDTVEWLGIEI